MLITKNFYIDEFRVSSKYPELAAKINLTLADIQNIELLCIMVLQPLRDKLGYIQILSGKRSRELNMALQGSKTSDHLNGSAVDVVLETPYKTLNFYLNVPTRLLCIGQSILYVDRNNHYKPLFVHVSLPSKKHYQELMIKDSNENIFHMVGNEMFDCYLKNIKKHTKRHDSW